MGMDLAEKIRKRMKELGMSQGDLALELGVSQQSLSHWLSGRNQPKLDNFFYLLDVLGLEIELKEVTNEEHIN